MKSERELGICIERSRFYLGSGLVKRPLKKENSRGLKLENSLWRKVRESSDICTFLENYAGCL